MGWILIALLAIVTFPFGIIVALIMVSLYFLLGAIQIGVDKSKDPKAPSSPSQKPRV